MDDVFTVRTGSQFVVYGTGQSLDPLLNLLGSDDLILQQSRFYKTTLDSLEHLYSLASGLFSTIPGGTHVTEDLCNAHAAALYSGNLGVTLDFLLRDAIKEGSKIRSVTGLEELSRSLLDSALNVVLERTSFLDQHFVLIVGNGDVSRLAVEFFHSHGARQIILATSDKPFGKRMLDEFGVQLINEDEILPFLQLSDIVINEDSFDHILEKHLIGFSNKCGNKVILDFASASTLQKQLVKSPSMTLFTLDDIHQLPLTNADLFHVASDVLDRVRTHIQALPAQLDSFSSAPYLISSWEDISSRQRIDPAAIGKVNEAPAGYRKLLLKERSMPSVTGDTRSTESSVTSRHVSRDLVKCTREVLN